MTSILYENKKSITDILELSKIVSKDLSIDENLSTLIFGDNFVALSSLLPKFKGKIDLVYIDPPFNTMQDFYISDNKANSISHSKKDEIAYSDHMSKEEYLEFMRERLILLKELLSEQGSIYIHIDYKIGHYIKILMDEIFGENNFKNDIARVKSNPKNFHRKAYGNEKDLILFYSKNAKKNIWNDITEPLSTKEIEKNYNKIDENGRRYTTIPLHAPGETQKGVTGKAWRNMMPPKGRHWRASPETFDELDKNGDIEWSKNGNPRIKKYADNHNGKKIQDIWMFKDPQKTIYPTQKNISLLDRIILQSSNENSIVLDCFAGSGTTLESSLKNNRKFIGIDNSNEAIKAITKRSLGIYNFIKI